jgi:hypothetical protein
VTIAFEQALALCRSDPEAAARMLCELSRQVDLPHQHSLFSSASIRAILARMSAGVYM